MDDRIFLLSIEEFREYADHIPKIMCLWWLRSPGVARSVGSYVSLTSYEAFDFGIRVNTAGIAVRPALRLNDKQKSLEIGDRFIEAWFPWIVIGDDIAIAEMPVAFLRFDEESNNYETSDVRRFLLGWYEGRMKDDANVG